MDSAKVAFFAAFLSGFWYCRAAALPPASLCAKSGFRPASSAVAAPGPDPEKRAGFLAQSLGLSLHGKEDFTGGRAPRHPVEQTLQNGFDPSAGFWGGAPKDA